MDTSAKVGQVMSDLEKFGRFYASSVLFVAIAISLITGITGTLMLIKKTEYDRVTQGLVISLTDCDNNGSALKCNTTVTYTVGTTPYSVTFNTSRIYKQGDKVLIQYKSTNAAEAKLGVSTPNKTLAWSLILGGLTFLAMTVFMWVVVRKYKTAALIQGTSGAFSLLRGLGPV